MAEVQNATDYTFLQNLATAVGEIPPDAIVSRTLYAVEDLKVILFGFAPGQELSEHTSARRAVLQFIAGQARLTVGDDPMTAGPGTFVAMQPHVPHSIEAETEVVMLLIMAEKAPEAPSTAARAGGRSNGSVA